MSDDNGQCGQTKFKLVFLFAIGIAFFEACAQNSLKQSCLRDSEMIAVAGVVFYIIVATFLRRAYTNHIELSKMNIVWSCISIILASVAGYVIYEESMNGYNITAIIFAMMSLILSYLSYVAYA